MAHTESIGDRLRRLREAAGLTQAELADEAGVSRPSVNEIETGITAKPRRGTLSKLAGALNVPLATLQGGRALSPAPPPADPALATPQMQALADPLEVRYLKEKVADRDKLIEALRQNIEWLSTYLPEQLGKLVPDSYAAEPRARVGFALANVQMLCNGRAYTDARHEVRSIWHEESTLRPA